MFQCKSLQLKVTAEKVLSDVLRDTAILCTARSHLKQAGDH